MTRAIRAGGAIWGGSSVIEFLFCICSQNRRPRFNSGPAPHRNKGEYMPSKSDLQAKLKQIKTNIATAKYLDIDRFLHVGMDEGGILGTPTVYFANNKDYMPFNAQYLGYMSTRAIKKYLTSLLFTWVAFDMPDYSKDLKIQFIKEGEIKEEK